MALSNKYGQVDIPGIADDEPVFVVRAQDALAIPLLVEYARMRLNIPSGDFDRDEYKGVVEQFAKWSPKQMPS